MTTMRLLKADLEILATVDNHISQEEYTLTPKLMKAWSGFYERVLKAEMKPRKPKASISVSSAIAAFRGVLGKRLVMPAGTPGPAWYAQLQNRINASGLTEELCKLAACAAATLWKGPIKAESIIRQADVLLSEAILEALSPGAPPEHEDMSEL